MNVTRRIIKFFDKEGKLVRQYTTDCPVTRHQLDIIDTLTNVHFRKHPFGVVSSNEEPTKPEVHYEYSVKARAVLSRLAD